MSDGRVAQVFASSTARFIFVTQFGTTSSPSSAPRAAHALVLRRLPARRSSARHLTSIANRSPPRSTMKSTSAPCSVRKVETRTSSSKAAALCTSCVYTRCSNRRPMRSGEATKLPSKPTHLCRRRNLGPDRDVRPPTHRQRSGNARNRPGCASDSCRGQRVDPRLEFEGIARELEIGRLVGEVDLELARIHVVKLRWLITGCKNLWRRRARRPQSSWPSR